jgi:hypothetical protein
MSSRRYRFGILDPLYMMIRFIESQELDLGLTLNVQARFRFRQRVQGADSIPATLRQLCASHATRDLRHSSQLENWVRRVTTRSLMV